MHPRTGLGRFILASLLALSLGGEKRVAFDLQEQAIEDLNRTLSAIQSKGYDLNWK